MTISDSTKSEISLLRKLRTAEGFTYPTLAAGIAVTANAAGWTLGAFTEIVPAATITSDFIIKSVNIEAVSADDTYELVLYHGASDYECGKIKFSKLAAGDGQEISFTGTGSGKNGVILANSKIRAKLACAAAAANTATISIIYVPIVG